MSPLRSLAGAAVLVTGGAGLIGKAVVKALDDEGAIVTVFDREEAEFQWERETAGGRSASAATGAGTFIAGDVTDARAMSAALTGMDAIVHLGGYAGLGMADGAETYRVNAVGTYVALSEAAARSLSKAVYASSINASGYPLGGSELPPSYPYDESSPPAIADWYSLSKQAGEDAARMVNRRWGLPITGLRFPLVRDITLERGAAFGRHLRDAMAADPRRQAAEGWSYLDVADAGRAVVAALLSDTPPAPGILVAAPSTYLAAPTDAALDQFAPGVPRAPIEGRRVPLDLRMSRSQLDFEASVFLEDVAPDELVDITAYRARGTRETTQGSRRSPARATS